MSTSECSYFSRLSNTIVVLQHAPESVTEHRCALSPRLFLLIRVVSRDSLHKCRVLLQWKHEVGSQVRLLPLSSFRCHWRIVRPQGLPHESCEQAKALAPLFNRLVDRVSRDGPWLKKVLADVLVSSTTPRQALLISIEDGCLTQTVEVATSRRVSACRFGKLRLLMLSFEQLSRHREDVIEESSCSDWYIPP